MPEWTGEQRDAICARGKNILVAAAAGSGKTAVLTERIRRLVTEDRVSVSSLLVVTFTDAAASEMRRRIEDALGEAMDREGNDDFMRLQLRRLRSAQISTFHAFALSILKNYYYVIGMEPSFHICDEFRSALMKQEALDLLFEERFASGAAAFTDFLSRYADSRGENGVRAMILLAYGFIRSLPDPFEWLGESVERLGASDGEFRAGPVFAWLRRKIKSELSMATKEISRVGEMLVEVGAPYLADKNAADLAAITEAMDSFADGEGWDRMADALSFKFQIFKATKEEKDSYEMIRGEVTPVRNRAKKRMAGLVSAYFGRSLAETLADVRDTRRYAAELASLVRRFDEIFAGLKREDGVIDFDDIEHFALEVLNDDRVAEELRGKYEHIFVDEYQDSNYVQEALISKVCRADNRFMVGDVKQSIYRFRHAEPGIFAEKYRRYPEDDGSMRVDLNMNFRSKAPIIDAVNGVFSRLMGERTDGSPGMEEGDGIGYGDEAALKPGLPYDRAWDVPSILRVVDIASVATDDGSGTVGGVDEEILSLKEAEREALAVAAVIREARGRMFYDAKMGAVRPMEYRDMALLLREAKTSGPIFTETLLGEGISAYAESGDGYLGTVEIETFMNLLRVIDNTRQDVPLVSALYSPVFGFTTDELAEIRMSCGDRKCPFYKAFHARAGTGGELGAKCAAALARIVGWRREESFMELSDFLWLILKESGWYDYAGGLAGGALRRANLLAMQGRATEYGAGGARGLFGFIRYIESVEDKKLPVPQAKLVTEGEDTVRVMTVHRSKGLEYPLVIVAGLGKKLGAARRGGRLSLHRKLGLALTLENPEAHTWRRTLLMDAIDGAVAAEEREELIRVLYVAMTRAQDRLVLIGSMKGAGEMMDRREWTVSDGSVRESDTFLKMLLPLAHEAGIVSSVVTTSGLSRAVWNRELERGRAVARLEDIENGGSMERREVRDEIDRRLSFVYPHEAATRLKSKYSVTELNRGVANPLKSPQTFYYMEESAAEASEDEGRSAMAADEGEAVMALRRPESGVSAAERGSALHKAIERLDYVAACTHCVGADDESDGEGAVADGEPGSAAWFEAYLDGLADDGFLTPEQRASVGAGDLMAFASSDICTRAAASPRVRREIPFNYHMDMDGEQVIVQGIIDLFFEEGDGLVLVDFKSGGARGKPEDRARYALDKYGEQMRLYRAALGSITGKRVREALFYLTDSGQIVSME
ncbi:MAG: helicase-exonuclease AddAB subunit AddA [Clostridiales Family XIII bacterium]|jgi:ATP-dependent helicase/nuclease subunit A|nr:helicase-exonuclease AddAB subunit AddA [Clostridiales Family XIII bacterium]